MPHSFLRGVVVIRRRDEGIPPYDVADNCGAPGSARPTMRKITPTSAVGLRDVGDAVPYEARRLFITSQRLRARRDT